MTQLNESDILVKMLEQTNANIINFKDDISSRLERIETRHDQYQETFVTRNEFTGTNERLVNDIANLVRKFEQIADNLNTNRVEQSELLRRIQTLEEQNKRLEEKQKQKDNHKKAMVVGIISSLALAVFEFINSHLIK